MGSVKITNLLLIAVTALLVLNLAIPALDRPEAPPPAVASEPIPTWVLADLKTLVEELRVAVRLPAPAAAVSPVEDPDDALVVRIPGRLADEWGLTAEDVRAVINALARAGKSLGSPRLKANQVSAIATLRNCSSAQAQFQATAKADADRDGTGEFGSFVELSGARDVRGDRQVGRLNPPVLSGKFRVPSESGLIMRSGYYYLIYLPDRSGGGVAADAEGFANVDADLAECHWCCYAWPVDASAGQRTFFVNQCGDVLATVSPNYMGTTPPLPGAAFKGGGRASITGFTAIGTTGQDGNFWLQVN